MEWKHGKLPGNVQLVAPQELIKYTTNFKFPAGFSNLSKTQKNL